MIPGCSQYLVAHVNFIHIVKIHFLHFWIDPLSSKSYHIMSLTLYESFRVTLNRFTFESSQKMYESNHENFLTCLESIHNSLNRFILHPWLTWIDSNLYWIASIFISLWLAFLLFESIHTFSESFHYVVFCQNFALASPFYIYSLPHNTKIIESFAFILSRSR